MEYWKLDGVGPVDNRPSPAKLLNFVRKKKKKKLLHVTHDMWDMTHDTWHVTCDMFGEVNIPSKFQLPSSYCLWFMIIWRSGGKGSLNELINEWINDEAVYRTPPATPGLLIISSVLPSSDRYTSQYTPSGVYRLIVNEFNEVIICLMIVKMI